MRVAEPALQRREVERGELDPVELDRDLVALAGVAHVEDEADVLVGGVDALGVEPFAGARRERLERLAYRVRRRGRDAPHERLAELVLDVGRDEAQRREDARLLRDDHRVRAEDLRECVRVHAAGAAEGHEGELARRSAPLHRHDPQRAEHRLVHHVHDRACGLLDAGAARLGDPRDRLRGPRPTSSFIAPPSSRGGQMAEHDVGVRDGGGRPAAAVARGPGDGAGALGADAERSGGLRDVRDRAASRADARHVDGRRAHGEVADVRLARDLRPAGDADGDVGRRAAHVEGEDAVEPGPGGDERRAADTTRRGRRARSARGSCRPPRGSSGRRPTARPGSVREHVPQSAHPGRSSGTSRAPGRRRRSSASSRSARTRGTRAGSRRRSTPAGPGATLAAISATTRSWRPLAWAFSRQTVSASTPSATSASIACRTAASSIASMIAPSAPIRSGTSCT